MMTRFKVGDRVIAYDYAKIIRGKIDSVLSNENHVTIKPDNSESLFYCHIKQCRKLIKKKVRKFTIYSSTINTYLWVTNGYNKKPDRPYVETIYVKECKPDFEKE